MISMLEPWPWVPHSQGKHTFPQPDHSSRRYCRRRQSRRHTDEKLKSGQQAVYPNGLAYVFRHLFARGRLRIGPLYTLKRCRSTQIASLDRHADQPKIRTPLQKPKKTLPLSSTSSPYNGAFWHASASQLTPNMHRKHTHNRRTVAARILDVPLPSTGDPQSFSSFLKIVSVFPRRSGCSSVATNSAANRTAGGCPRTSKLKSTATVTYDSSRSSCRLQLGSPQTS